MYMYIRMYIHVLPAAFILLTTIIFSLSLPPSLLPFSHPPSLPLSLQPPSDMSGLFAGLSVAGKSPSTATPTAVVKPTHSLSKKTSPRTVKRERSLKKVQNEGDSSFGDILGLTSSNVTPTASTTLPTVIGTCTCTCNTSMCVHIQ